MFAVTVQGLSILPTWATFALYALTLGCVGVVGLPTLSLKAQRFIMALLVAVVLGGAAVTYAAVVEEPYRYGFCAYIWIMDWFC